MHRTLPAQSVSSKLCQTTSPPSRAEKLFAIVALLLSAGAFGNLWAGAEVSAESSIVGVGSIYVVLYLIMLFLLKRHCKGYSRLFLSEWPLVTSAAFAMASALWSEAPATSFKYGFNLLLTFLFGLYLGVRYSLKDLLKLLAWVLGICIVFSFIFGFFGLGTSVDAGDGVLGWYGVFSQKNNLGTIMTLSAIVFLLWKRVEPEHRWLSSIGFLGSLALVALSRSTTSMVTLGVLLLLMPCLQWMVGKGARRTVAGFTFLIAVGSALFAYIATHLAVVTGLLGKSVTLTGRLQLWLLCGVMALQRPWLGYGYEAFWMEDRQQLGFSVLGHGRYLKRTMVSWNLA